MPRTSLSVSSISNSGKISRAWRISDGVLIQNSFEVKRLFTTQRSRDTVNTPNFRAMKKDNKGDFPMNPFQYVEVSELKVNGTYTYFDKVNNVQGYQTGTLYTLAIPGFPVSFTQDLRDTVHANSLNKSLNNLKGMKVNVGNVAGQMKQTVNMILGTAQKIGTSLRALKKGNFRNAAVALGASPGRRRNNQSLGQSPSKALADEWLALQFGWKPLINDVYEGAEDLARLHNEPRRTRVTASATARWNTNSSNGDWEGIPVIVTDEGQYTRKYVYIFSYRQGSLADLSRFGLTNPLAVAWELLPWSFVVDWFIPVGNFIDTLDATAGLEFEKGCVTTFRKTRTTANCNAARMVGTAYSTMNAMGYEEIVLCTRTKLNGFPAPALPQLGIPSLSPTRGVTISALLRQRLKL